MTINRTNIILMVVNLLGLGILLGAGAVTFHHHGGMMMQPGDFGPGGPPNGGPGGGPGNGPERLFGPEFHGQLQEKLLQADPNWKQEIVAARSAMQAALVADPFDAAEFKKNATDFDRLMDEFHDTMHQQINDHIPALSLEDRQNMAKMIGNMHLPLVDEDKRDEHRDGRHGDDRRGGDHREDHHDGDRNEGRDK